jgi:polyhydroxyalkanoate synthesis repressor PhaR
MERQRLLKRYDNRKLYDTAASRYVKLEEVAELVRLGLDVKVVHHRTGRDVTSVALAHILFAEELAAERHRPRELAALLRSGPAGAVDDVPLRRPAGAPEGGPSPLPVLLGDASRAHFQASATARSARRTTAALEQRASTVTTSAREVLADLGRARRELLRLERQLDGIHERLRGLETACDGGARPEGRAGAGYAAVLPFRGAPQERRRA